MAFSGTQPKSGYSPRLVPTAAENPARWTRFAGSVLILLAAAIAAAPVRIHGVVASDDFEFHFVSWLDAQQNWRHGIPYPHWAASPNLGAGEPRFIFYPPLTWILGAALGRVLPWTLVPAALTFLVLAATGLATRALARQVLAEAPATLAGCAALFSGYALFSAYERCAYGELCGGLWIPLLLLFALRDRHPSASPRRRALDGSALPLSLALAGAWLSDAPAGVIASYLLAAVALAAALLARSWFPVVRAAIAAALGIALPAFYLVPAAWEQRWVSILRSIGVKGDPGLRIENNWLFQRQPSPSGTLRDQSLHLVTLVAASMIAVALVSLFALWLRNKLSPQDSEATLSWPLRPGAPGQPTTRNWWIALALIPPAVLFLLLPISLPIWNLLPKLRFLQFPWRWLLVLEAPMAIFFAAAVWPGKSRKPWKRPAVACLCALFFLAATLFAERNFFRDGVEEDDVADILDSYRSGTGFVGTEEYAPPGTDNAIVATGLPDACLADRSGVKLGIAASLDATPDWRADQGTCAATVAATLRQPEHLRIVATVAHAGFLILRLRSYPAWRITVNGRLATNLPARADGLITIPVEQGPVDVAADWTTTSDVILSRWLSGAAVMLLIGLGLLERNLSRPRRS
jgi:hypothetical protein